MIILKIIISIKPYFVIGRCWQYKTLWETLLISWPHYTDLPLCALPPVPILNLNRTSFPTSRPWIVLCTFFPAHNFPRSARVPPVKWFSVSCIFLCPVYFSLSKVIIGPFSFFPFPYYFPSPFTIFPSYLPFPRPFQQTYHTACPFILPPVPQRALITPTTPAFVLSSCLDPSMHCSLLYVRAKLLDGRAVTVTSQRTPALNHKVIHARALTVTSQTTHIISNPRVPRNWPQDA